MISHLLLAFLAFAATTVVRAESPQVRADELASGRHDGKRVRVVGTVRDAFRDEIDANWAYLILSSDEGLVTVTLRPEASAPWPDLAGYIGSCVEVEGRVERAENGARRHLGRVIKDYTWSALRVLRAREDDPFTAAELKQLADQPVASDDFTVRRRAVGRVVAVWHGDTALLRGRDGEFVKVTFATDGIPSCGDLIEAVGFPETDLYRYNLNRAIFRKLPDPGGSSAETPRDVAPERLRYDDRGRARIDMEAFGSLVRFTGIVPAVSAPDRASGRLALRCGSVRMTVDATACPSALDGLAEGETVSVTGVLVVDTEIWARGAFFPRIRDLFVVLRSADDLVVVARAPWWTVGRLLVAVALLIAALIGVAVWNVALNRTVERRSRELLREQVARARETLRVDERTRLAAELHDSVAQSLSGVALQLDAAERLATVDAEKMRRRVSLAGRLLAACREELRNCLWDLRSDALNVRDMNEAISIALRPVIGDAEATVRFNVSRSRLPDATLHALMRIVRELAANAVRHGDAKRVKVAGAIDGTRIRFSISDDGRGFDPERCPGPAEGHFGLQGIRERLRSFDGELSIESAPGKGTRVRVEMS